MPNVQQKRLYSTLLGQMVSLKLASSTIRSIDHVGSLDKFVLNQNDLTLSKRALSIKTRMLRKLRGQKRTTVKTAKPAATAKTAKTAKKKAE